MALSASYHPDPKILEFGPDFYDPVAPAVFREVVPRFLNRRWAGQVFVSAGMRF